MRPATVVKCFPFSKFFEDVYIISVFYELVELLLVCKVRAFHFAIEVRACLSDINMAHAQVFAVPTELGLELMTIIGLYGVDAKRKLTDYVGSADLVKVEL